MNSVDRVPALRIRDLQLGVRGQPGMELLHGVSLDVNRGERVGLVGESGSGKSLLSLSVMGLLPSTIEFRGGSIEVGGAELVGAPDRVLDELRGTSMSMIYQDPMSSLNPVRTIGHQIGEVLHAHTDISRLAARRRAIELLDDVGVHDPSRSVDSYPHEFSGGMRQRVVIAMAIACEPDLLLADEPTTALDVTTQAKIIDLLDALVDERGMGVIFVTHDLAVAAAFCNRIDVMRKGLIVETGDVSEILTRPKHPYTQQLVDSIITFGTDPNQPIGAGRSDLFPGGDVS